MKRMRKIRWMLEEASGLATWLLLLLLECFVVYRAIMCLVIKPYNPLSALVYGLVAAVLWLVFIKIGDMLDRYPG